MDSEQIADNGLILEIIAGSTCYGLNLPTSDEDRMGICVVPKVSFFGFGQEGSRFEHHVTTHPDQDRTVYSLQKFLTLLLKGNPTILNLIFADEQHVTHTTEFGEMLRDPEVYKMLVNESAAGAYLGYMSQQIKLLENHGTGEVLSRVKRPGLVDDFGFDTKYAMHALRLGYQGCELLTTGTIPFPMRDGYRMFLMDVRNGKVQFDFVMNEARRLLKELELLKNDNVLHPVSERALASRILYELQNEFWKQEPLNGSFYSDPTSPSS